MPSEKLNENLPKRGPARKKDQYLQDLCAVKKRKITGTNFASKFFGLVRLK
jgi:hypothetical protein